MRIAQTLLILLAAFASLSCGGNNRPDTAPPAGQLDAAPQPRAAARGTAAAPAATAAPAPTEDAQWTIFVHVVRGPSHIGESKRLKDQLMASSGLKQWYIVHGATESTLYHGYYRTVSGEEPDARRARADLDKIESIKDKVTGKPLFAAAMAVPLNSADPEAPPEWDLVNSGGYYSLEIASYSGSPQRKQAAVDTVREARAQGIPAYYYHGETTSSVCVGAWPKEAAEQAAPVPNARADRTVIVSTGPRDENVERAMIEAAAEKRGIGEISRDPIHVAPQFIPKDPGMIEMMRRFPHRYVNGEVVGRRSIDPKTRKPVVVPLPSYIVVVPRKKENLLRQDGIAETRPDPGRQADFGSKVFGQPEPAPRPDTPRRGQLKSIGE